MSLCHQIFVIFYCIDLRRNGPCVLVHKTHCVVPLPVSTFLQKREKTNKQIPKKL